MKFMNQPINEIQKDLDTLEQILTTQIRVACKPQVEQTSSLALKKTTPRSNVLHSTIIQTKEQTRRINNV